MSSQQSVPPSGPRMCNGKNCNFYGDPVTGLCSKCYREEQAARKAANGTAPTAAAPTPAPAPAPASVPIAMPTMSAPIAIPGRAAHLQLEDVMPSSVPNQGGFPSSLSSSPTGGMLATSASPPGRSSNRCHICQKKVGLLGFKCRCEQTFCSAHRHADAHHCTFDYKAAGREELTKANPLVVTKKVEQI